MGGEPGMPSEDMGRWVVGRSAEDARAAAEAKYPGRSVRLAQDEDVLDTWCGSGRGRGAQGPGPQRLGRGL